MLKTLLVSEVFPPQTGGSGRWLWEVYRRLPRESVVVAAGEHPNAVEFDRTHDLRLVRLPLAMRSWGLASRAGMADYWRAASALEKLIRREGVGQIHCGKCLPEGALAWLLRRRFGLPYLCYVHGEELNIAQGSRELGWLTRRVLRGASAVVANSQNTRRLLVDAWGVRPRNVRLLNPGVDTRRFQPAPRCQEQRRSLGWEGRFVMLTVGRLQKRKGQDMLIRALRQIKSQIPNVLYAIAGNGEESEALRRLATDEGVSELIQFRGEVRDDELPVLYQQCDLFALPNREVNGDFEGFGMVLVEAQACGKPVLAGDSGGTAETMQRAETGVIVDCRSPDVLADAVIELASHPERLGAMGQAARRWALEQFDWESLVQQAREILDLTGGETRCREYSPSL